MAKSDAPATDNAAEETVLVNRQEFEDLKALVAGLAEKEIARAQSPDAISQAEELFKLARSHSGGPMRPDYHPLEGPQREALDKVDPLGFIDEAVGQVYMVGRVGSLPLRQEWQTQGGATIPKRRLKRMGTPNPWYSCPYVFQGNTPQDTVSQQLLNKDWHRFVITKADAAEAWIGRMPFPEEVVVRKRDFEAFRGGMVYGTRMRSSGIDLREIVRFLMQTNGQMLWFDTDRYCPNVHGRIQGLKYEQHSHISGLEPNPYHEGCAGSLGNFKTMQPSMGITPFPHGFAVNDGHSAEVVDEVNREVFSR